MWNWYPSYWPESALNKVNPNHVIVEVGIGSSDYDRACEVFYQLIGGTVDYGQEHADKYGHSRFGRHFGTALFPTWSAVRRLSRWFVCVLA